MQSSKVLRTLILGSLIIGTLTSVFLVTKFCVQQGSYSGISPIFPIIFTGLNVLLYFTALKFYNFTALIHILTLIAPTIYFSVICGSLAPQALLMYVLSIFITNILIGPEYSFAFTIWIAVFLSFLSYVQHSGIFPADMTWREKPYNLIDGFTAGISLIIIALISWLYNKEMNHAFNMVKKSEAALKKEMDSLETKVEERTKELRENQTEKLNHISKFVEFGKLASGLFHDIANPLNIISLNLEQMSNKCKENKASELLTQIERARTAKERVEQFLYITRKHFQSQEIAVKFNIEEEIKNTLKLLKPKAEQARVNLVLSCHRNLFITGNPIRFFQLIKNLVANGIDAHTNSGKNYKEVRINVNVNHNLILIKVIDNGIGIDEVTLNKVFEPFFTTKSADKGLGLGLPICQEIVGKDFGGRITADSIYGNGSVFTVQIPKSL